MWTLREADGLSHDTNDVVVVVAAARRREGREDYPSLSFVFFFGVAIAASFQHDTPSFYLSSSSLSSIFIANNRSRRIIAQQRYL